MNTPGPWYTMTKPDALQGLIASEIDGKTIAVSYDPIDAHLISAAPDLLEACQAFVEFAQNGKHPKWASYLRTITGRKMIDAITKAKGE